MAEPDQYELEQQAPDLPPPVSMGGMAPPPVALPPMPPPPMANPGLAAGYGMMAGLQGQVGNPYLAMQPQMQALAGQNMNQLLQMQTNQMQMQMKQMQMQQLQQRIDIERKRQATLEQEGPLKLAQALLKIDTPAAQQIAGKTLSGYLEKTLGIKASPDDLVAPGDMKKDQVDNIDAMLDLARKKTPPGGRPDYSMILSVYPGTKISYLDARYQIGGDPNARQVASIPQQKDPAQFAAEAIAKESEAWVKGHPEFGNTDLYGETNSRFLALTGRQLFRSTEQERPLVEKLRLESEIAIDARKKALQRPNYIDVARDGLEADALLKSTSAPKPGTPEFKDAQSKVQLWKQTQQLYPLSGEMPILVNRAGETIKEIPVGPKGLSGMIEPGTLMRPPSGVTRSDLADRGVIEMTADQVAAYKNIPKQFATIREIMGRRKDLYPPRTGDKVTDTLNALYAQELLGRTGFIDDDVRAINVFKGTMPQLMRAFGGTSKQMDSNIELAMTQKAFLQGPGLREPAETSMNIVEDLISSGFESMGLKSIKASGGKPAGTPSKETGVPLLGGKASQSISPPQPLAPPKTQAPKSQQETLSRSDPRYQKLLERGMTDATILQKYNVKVID